MKSKPEIPAHMDDWEPRLIAPQCLSCSHCHGGPADAGTCDAFPSGIPKPIYLNEVIHDSEYPGDHGILYQPKG
ncbi:hypothetical protein [Burkholderia vietnamiensis]|uniref:hypothetical protein n=1 Tax=Burkholderia vietnamiensis TaxID=60552 RepID=UPI002652C24C|nr:hypothetical protein [Burkholderia vietnamiensis]MDN8035511.1 hypothetical protein [Burkholderia vietnamiensis]HDV8353269.1 hypothetical protein [Burkholderia vietnamiensis]